MGVLIYFKHQEEEENVDSYLDQYENIVEEVVNLPPILILHLASFCVKLIGKEGA